VKRSAKLAGLDVILVHRMLKNAVPIPEYLLLSEALFRRMDDRVRSRGQALAQELEGLGVVPTYFMDVAGIAGDAPPAPEVTALRRFRENLGVVLRSLPYKQYLELPGTAQRRHWPLRPELRRQGLKEAAVNIRPAQLPERFVVPL
jgi:uncharacterized protein DUF2652